MRSRRSSTPAWTSCCLRRLPGFRPQHLAACIDANKHVFCEKPIATDAPGVRSVLATAEKAREKNLNLVSGFCWRYSNMIQDTFQTDRRRRDRQAGGLLRHLLHESRQADAAGQRASGGHERYRVADPQLVQLRVAVRR